MDNFISVRDFENHALSVLEPTVKNYYLGGTKAEETTKLNIDSFKKFRIRPKVLRNVSKRDISTTILGEKVSMPLGVSPTAHQRWAHLCGERASAKATESIGTIFILSSYSNCTIQEVAKAAPNAIKWQQLAIHKDRDCTRHIVQTAEIAGFKAIVVSVDYPILSKSSTSKIKITKDARFCIYEDYYLSKNSQNDLGDIFSRVKTIIDDSVTWQDLLWLKSITQLPIVVKGVLTAEDAVLAVNHGASAILVSNHGGRQLTSTISSIEALPEIVAAVGNKVEVYVDGGVRHGTDVFKALAVGAKMVFVGRPIIWGLVCDGEKGARAVLDLLYAEIEETFALAGCRNVHEVTRDLVKHKSLYSHL
ncbi:2-Hydroxyacid oxidase 1-like isoform X2 [Phymastichus coffea]|uniref:2-Hydroxyacid oxidase 1-like isoform X2 n=1 Tax=Phymastichus coffea TaxID=108790 RepID=UPI00273CF251|nr:2-Hydroxyacid oxidase 1-like isoform X2 [Phymastichus coffea]